MPIWKNYNCPVKGLKPFKDKNNIIKHHPLTPYLHPPVASQPQGTRLGKAIEGEEIRGHFHPLANLSERGTRGEAHIVFCCYL
jgi:hypothetical protein